MKRALTARNSWAWVAFFAAFSASPSLAQMAPPDVEVKTLSERRYSHIEEDEPAVGTEMELASLRVRSADYDELAVIKVAFKGKWYQSADAIAREKAAALGANYLALQQSIGKEEWGTGAVKVYKAVRLTDFSGGPSYTKPPDDPLPQQAKPAPPSAGVPSASVAPVSSPPAEPLRHRHFVWVWQDGPHQVSHRIVFDPSQATARDLQELEHYVARNFSRMSLRTLRAALKKGALLEIDLKGRALHERGAR